MRKKKLFLLILAFCTLVIVSVITNYRMEGDMTGKVSSPIDQSFIGDEVTGNGVITRSIPNQMRTSIISFQGSTKFATHINILRRSSRGGSEWDEGDDINDQWGGSAETNYIDPSWYGPTVSWIGYARVQAGNCCWSCGLFCTDCAIGTLRIKFRNIGTGQETEDTPTSSGSPVRLNWDLGTVSDVGYWQMWVKLDNCAGWWDQEAKMWEATMIAVVTT